MATLQLLEGAAAVLNTAKQSEHFFGMRRRPAA
jgi:hypothetical protein